MTAKDDLNTDISTIRLPAGTNARINRVLKGGELRSGFFRAAVEAELRRREQASSKKMVRA